MVLAAHVDRSMYLPTTRTSLPGSAAAPCKVREMIRELVYQDCAAAGADTKRDAQAPRNCDKVR